MTTTLARRIRRLAGIAAAFLLLAAGPARAGDAAMKTRPQGATAAPSDAAIQEGVIDAVLGYAYYGVFDSVGVTVQDAVVTLHGSVRQPWRRKDIEGRVARVEGIREVRNEIRVQPASAFDDRLRRELYQAIYGSGFFQRYAAFANPPVRIVVENGNITLTGLVNSRVEKVKLESIARGMLAFRVDNQVEVESERDAERVAGKED